MKKNLPSPASALLIDELRNTKGNLRLIILAMLANIPFWGFVPYLTQVTTVLLLAIFLKRNLKSFDKPMTGLIIMAMFFQAFWFAFTSQIVTLILLGIIYAFATKYLPSQTHDQPHSN